MCAHFSHAELRVASGSPSKQAWLRPQPTSALGSVSLWLVASLHQRMGAAGTLPGSLSIGPGQPLIIPEAVPALR